MSGEEFVLSVIAIVMGASVVIVAITKVTDLIKSWIHRNHNTYNDETFERLAKAFMQHKKDMEKRVRNLEAIIAEKDHPNHYNELEIEEPREDNTLNNNLEERKRRVR